jgi:chromosome partitioning protein
MSRIIAISNEKGGVAKTTSVISLGASLAELGRQVLLLDLDPQANLTLSLGLEPGEAQTSTTHILLEGVPMQGADISTDFKNLSIIPSDTRMVTAEHFLPMRKDYRTILRSAIKAGDMLKYDYLLLDCPPALGAITVNALSAANLLIIPTQAEYFSAYALRNMMNLVRQVRRDGNPGLSYRILVTMLDSNNESHKNIHAQLRNTFGDGVLTTVIEMDAKLRESPIAGLPITVYRTTTRGAVQYRVLAQELVEHAKEFEFRQPA